LHRIQFGDREDSPLFSLLGRPAHLTSCDVDALRLRANRSPSRHRRQFCSRQPYFLSPKTNNLKTTVELECTTLVLHSKLSQVGAWIPVAHRRISCHAHRGMIACPVFTIQRTRAGHSQCHNASAFRRKRYDALRKTVEKRGPSNINEDVTFCSRRTEAYEVR
jgi:hypothetical protein